MVHMPKRILLSPLHRLNNDHREGGQHGLHLFGGIHEVGFPFRGRLIFLGV